MQNHATAWPCSLHASALRYRRLTNLNVPNDGQPLGRRIGEDPMVIFDGNGVIVDSEPIAHAVLADAFAHAGISLSAEAAASRFTAAGPPTCSPRSNGSPARRSAGFRGGGVGGGGTAVSSRASTAAACRPCAELAVRPQGGRLVVAARSHSRRPRSGGPYAPFRLAPVLGERVAKGKPAPDLFRYAAVRLGAMRAPAS